MSKNNSPPLSNNNLTSKSIINTIKLKYNNTNTNKNTNTNTNANKNTNTDKITDPDILVKVKNHLSINLKYWLVFVLPILLLLCYLLYSYNLGSRSKTIISNMKYKKNLKNTPLLQCYQEDVKYQYKLCDYYISSSYMTPCVGNQHYDYVSNDMIAEVIQSGARYIQIPICDTDVSPQALPVVGTAYYGKPLITSLNTLEITSALKTIVSNAFTLNNKTINYPLIIHFILNTTKQYTLNYLADVIKEVFLNNNLLVDVSKYIKFPIYLEKICNLLGKIIIISTPEYIGTKLESYIVPNTNLFNMYQFNKLDHLNLPSDSIYKTSYNNKLSSQTQKKTLLKFKDKYPTLDYIVKNVNTVGDTILNDPEILNNLTSFNKVGITVVTPNSNVDIVSTNYDTTESFFLGCQFIAMNFQINDINMKNYLGIFQDSSFRLKPSSMRFSETEEPITDLLAIYDKIVKKNDNVVNDFYYKYNNTLISFESYTLPYTFITQVENTLKFNVGSNQIKNQDGNITYKLDISQCFIPRKSTIGGSGNISMYFESAALPGMYITLLGGSFNLQELALNKQGLVNQAFYVEIPKTTDNEQPGDKGKMFSIRTFTEPKPLYISFENKIIKAYYDSPQIEAHNNMTFFVKQNKYKIIIKLITLYDGSLKSMSGDIIGVLETNTTDGTPYEVIPTGKNGGNFNLFKDQFNLQNTNTQKYVSYDDDTGFIYDRDRLPMSNSVFNLQSSNGYYNIVNVKNQHIILYDRNLVKFVESKTVLSNENLFKIDIKYEIVD